MARAARVMVVEDDAAVRRLVELALEDLVLGQPPIELLLCPDGASALQALHEAPVQLLITDLMMPGLSGYELLERLVRQPGLRQGARLVVFSAGLDGEARERLQGLDVWRLLDKPVSLQALEDCVRQALQAGPAGSHEERMLPAQGTTEASKAAFDAAGGLAEGEQAAIELQFGGDAELFHEFRASCLPQFVQDAQALDAALARADLPAVRRQAHSLKGVLATLGWQREAAQARALEAALQQADAEQVQTVWAALRSTLLARAASAGPAAG